MEDQLMPVSVDKMGDGFRVSTPGGVKAKKTSLEKALSQKRLLNAVDHGWKPPKVRPSKPKVFK